MGAANSVHPLDGKRVIFLGNSYVYYGQTVLNRHRSVLGQAERMRDKGYFYQLCRLRGAEVDVTNWTFGGHGLCDLFGAPCAHHGLCEGRRHELDLTDRAYDYVFASPGGGERSAASLAADFDYITRFFREANPNVRIICFGNLGAHGYSSFGKVLPSIYGYYPTLEDMGVTIADWGGIIKGIIDGRYAVSGGTQSYSASTFVVKDGFHPNQLTGYITSLTAYCAVTGERAEGMPYAFCGDGAVHPRFDRTAYLDKYYNSPEETNYPAVLDSPADMLGIQRLIDWYLAEKPYRA